MTDTQARDKLLDKIKKLLALATSPNENEAAAASEKVQVLLAEHNLSMGDVDKASKREDEAIIKDMGLMTDSLPWRRGMATYVAKMYFCSYLFMFEKKSSPPGRKWPYVRYDRHIFVGAAHNVAVAKMMFSYFCEAIEKLADKGALSVPQRERTSYRTSFKVACANRVGMRIEHRIAAAMAGQVKSETTGTTLPALNDLYEEAERRLKEHLAKEFGKLDAHNRKAKPTHRGGYRDGRAAGERIGLDEQIASRKTSNLALGRS